MAQWMERFALTFANDKTLLQKVEEWAEELKKQKESEKKKKGKSSSYITKIDLTPFFVALSKLKTYLDELAEQRRLEENEAKAVSEGSSKAAEEAPEDENVSTSIVKELSAKELAQQLTLVDFKIFSRISFSEFFHQNWVKHKENAQNLSAMIRWFNEVSLWVMTVIVNGTNAKDRAKKISKFINVAKEMRPLNNFNGIMLLLSALNNSSIRRLTAEWELVSQKAQVALDNLYELLNPEENFGNMRMALAMCSPPVIPFMGFYLTQVTYIDENDDTRDGLVNFNKMMMLGKIMLEVNRYQSANYSIKPLPHAQRYLVDRRPADKKKASNYGRMRWLDEKEVYHKSLEIKPRAS